MFEIDLWKIPALLDSLELSGKTVNDFEILTLGNCVEVPTINDKRLWDEV